MSKDGLRRFFVDLKPGSSLSGEFAKAVSDFARGKGFDVEPNDVSQFMDRQPRPRALPHQGPPSVTCAIGEEDGHGKITTMALGEEGKIPNTCFPRPPGGSVTTCALGEENKKPRPPGGGKTTKALGEEGGRPRCP